VQELSLFLRQLDGSVLLPHYTRPVMCIPLSDGMFILIHTNAFVVLRPESSLDAAYRGEEVILKFNKTHSEI
jgi:hypothetical protein